MKRLFVDTSNQYLYICVLEDSNKLFEHIQIGNNNHSETLMDKIEELFKKNNITINDIDEIFVGRGPGSYTGVRVACTICKVLAYTLHKPLYSFSSLDLLYTINLNPGITLVKMDARRGFSYAKVFEYDKEIKVLMEDSYIETEKLLNYYSTSFIINTEDAFVNKSCKYNILDILKFKLYRKEDDVHNFSPTYLRSGV